VDLTQAGQDLATDARGDYINRSHSGTQLQVIPQIKRAERLTAHQLEKIYVTGIAATNSSRCLHCEHKNHNGTADAE